MSDDAGDTSSGTTDPGTTDPDPGSTNPDPNPDPGTADPDPDPGSGDPGDNASNTTGSPARRTWWESNPIAANAVIAIVVALIGVFGTLLVSGSSGGGSGQDGHSPPPGPPPPGGPPQPGGTPKPSVAIDQRDGSDAGPVIDVTGTVDGLPDSYALWAVVRNSADSTYSIPPDPCRVDDTHRWKCGEIPLGPPENAGETCRVYVALVDAYGAHEISEFVHGAAGDRRKPALTSLPDHIELLDHITVTRTRQAGPGAVRP